MANWSMTVNEKTYNSPEISVGLYSAVAQVLGRPVTSFDELLPYTGPDVMAAWYAVLFADSGDDKNVQAHLLRAMGMPIAQLITTITILE